MDSRVYIKVDKLTIKLSSPSEIKRKENRRINTDLGKKRMGWDLVSRKHFWLWIPANNPASSRDFEAHFLHSQIIICLYLRSLSVENSLLSFLAKLQKIHREILQQLQRSWSKMGRINNEMVSPFGNSHPKCWLTCMHRGKNYALITKQLILWFLVQCEGIRFWLAFILPISEIHKKLLT